MAHRRNFRIALAVLLATVAPACLATQYTLSNGGFQFTIPDGWPRILQAPGDPSMQVFQDPDPSATGQQALARITVSSQSEVDIAAFRSYINQENGRAKTLPGYHLDKQRSTQTHFYYTANDGGVMQDYVVHYFLHNGYAIQVRCVRPARSDAGAAWIRAFDKGCADTTRSLR